MLRKYSKIFNENKRYDAKTFMQEENKVEIRFMVCTTKINKCIENCIEQNTKSRRYSHIHNIKQRDCTICFLAVLMPGPPNVILPRFSHETKINKDEMKKGWLSNGQPTKFAFVLMCKINLRTGVSFYRSSWNFIFTTCTIFIPRELLASRVILGKQNHKYFVFDLQTIKSRRSETFSQDMWKLEENS